MAMNNSNHRAMKPSGSTSGTSFVYLLKSCSYMLVYIVHTGIFLISTWKWTVHIDILLPLGMEMAVFRGYACFLPGHIVLWAAGGRLQSRALHVCSNKAMTPNVKVIRHYIASWCVHVRWWNTGLNSLSLFEYISTLRLSLLPALWSVGHLIILDKTYYYCWVLCTEAPNTNQWQHSPSLIDSWIIRHCSSHTWQK